MTDKKSDVNRAFSRAHNHTPKPEKHHGDTPEMIRRDKPIYRPKPPTLGHHVDAEIFNQRLAREAQSAGQAKAKRSEHMRQSAQVIKSSGLKLSDKFQRIEAHAREQKRDRSRGR